MTRTAKMITREQAGLKEKIVERIIKGVTKRKGKARTPRESLIPLIRWTSAKPLVWRLKQKIATTFHMMKKRIQVSEVSDRK